ncbi:MAG: glycine--tRNA ligase subunit beta, partial [Desulfovibrionaceae bacterium]|nr:glycine--tRNA ligase subunit beta [Desulfovibrionaceae bacterium]
MAEFILEIGTEEMPARFVSRLADEFRDIVAALFDQAGLECAPVRAWATPRRMVAAASGLAPVLRQEELLVVGPPARIAFDDQGDLTKAGQGFARTQGLDQAELFRHQNDKGEYLAGRKKVGGGPAADILPDICKRAIA